MKKHFLFLSALALFLSSCEIFSSLSEKTGAISIKMPEGSERIAETYDVNKITSFTAELYDSGSSPVAQVISAPGKSITFESLTPGSYAIVIKAFISEECAGYAEKSGIVVEAGATTYETITLFKNIIKNIESVEIAKESLDKITKNYTVGQTFALPDNVSIIAHFIHGYEKELEPNDYEIYICNAEQFAESSLEKDLTLSENSRFAVIGICTESGYKYSAPVSLVMNAEEPMENFIVTFNLNYDGSTDTTQSVTSGNAVSTPEVPTRDGYAFVGWYKEAECTNEYVFSTGVTENITLYAKWTEEADVITSWAALSEKLSSATEGENIYVLGDFEIASTISFSGTANIISTGNGVTFTRQKGYASDFFSLYSASLTFKGSESAPIVFDGTSETQTSNLITNGGTTTFEYCSFKNNSSSSHASVYLLDNYTSSNTTFRFCSFTGNKGPNGGAVYVGETAYNVCFENCRFENNTASDCGGAVYIKPSATATFSNCTFNSNTAIYYGGAVYIERSGTGSFSDCTFEGNSATHTTSSGGAICSSGTADITNCTFTSNSASYGGAINIDSGTMTISSATFNGNTAEPGSDIYNSNGILNIGGTIGSSVDIYMYNTTSNTSQALVPQQGITLASVTDTINVTMTKCSEGTTVLTQSDGMSNEEFATAINCFTLKNDGFVIDSNGTAVTQ